MLKNKNYNYNITVILPNLILNIGSDNLHIKRINKTNYELYYDDKLILDIFDSTFEPVSAENAASCIFEEIKDAILKNKKIIDLSKFL